MTDRSAPKTALVTGANRGIGFEIARALTKYGMNVLGGVRSEEKAGAAAAAFRECGADVAPVVLDVADVPNLPEHLRAIGILHGEIDILVNNAAILIDGPGGFDARLTDMTDDTFRHTWETNVFAPTVLIRSLLSGMVERGFGRIVNMSSAAGQLSTMTAGFPAYRMSKAALNALTRIAAAEASGTGVKVNACSPGWVRTEMGGPSAPRTPAQGAETAVWLATLGPDGPTGGFFQDKKPIPW